MAENPPVIKKKNFILTLTLIFLSFVAAYSQLKSFDVGLRFQKTKDLYYENGLTVQYNLSARWVIGATYVSSRFGSAWHSYAIKQDNYFVSGSYLFRHHRSLRPFVRLNAGYFNADYESPIFRSLPHTSAIVSLETGLGYSFKCPLKLNLSLGYNAITGDGIDNAGTLYPLFYQLSTTWNISKRLSH
jgi:hypothetical protein